MASARMLSSSRIRTAGMDPALHHGVVVVADWEFGDGAPPQLVTYNILSEWRLIRNRGRGVSATASYLDINRFADQLLSTLGGSLGGLPMGIDWDPNMVFWGNRLAGVKLTYLMGYLVRGLQTLGAVPVCIPPNDVRKFFGMSPQTPKESVWSGSQLALPDGPEDVMDALLLSYVVAESLFKEAP